MAASIVVVVTVPLLFVAAGAVRSASPAEPAMVERAGPPVELERARSLTYEETVRGVGTLRASARVEVRPELSGRIRSIDFREGAEVEAGQVLFQLDDEKLASQLEARQAGLRAAEVRAESAQRTFRRQEQLLERAVVAEDAFDRAQAELDAALAEVDRLTAEVALTERQRNDAVIRAPFAGVMGERRVDLGALVSAADVLGTLYQVDPLEIVFTLPERYAAAVQLGQPVQVEVAAYPGEPYTGRIDFISPAVEEATRTLRVKAVVANGDRRLHPGSFGQVEVVLGQREDRVFVPEEALVATRSGYMIFVVRDRLAEGRAVAIGMRRDGLVEVLEGLRAGEAVVRNGHLRLSGGERVEVVNEGEVAALAAAPRSY